MKENKRIGEYMKENKRINNLYYVVYILLVIDFWLTVIGLIVGCYETNWLYRINPQVFFAFKAVVFVGYGKIGKQVTFTYRIILLHYLIIIMYLFFTLHNIVVIILNI